jgi:peptide/nickel transport system substrate-binding protein
MEDYRSGMQTMANLIIANGRDNPTSTFFTEDEYNEYWAAVDKAGVDFVNSIFEACKDYGATTVGEAMNLWNYPDVAKDATPEECWKAIEDAYKGDLATANTTEQASVDLFDAINGYLGDDATKFATGIQTGEGADYISGIKKTGDYSMTLHMTKVDATAIYQLTMIVSPLSYYGDPANYDFDAHKFGFTKGDLSPMKAVGTVPKGAGAYKFVSYENGTVTLEANENYFLGCPKIKTILFKETSAADMLTGISTGTYDLTADDTFNTDAVTSIKGYNSNGELNGDVYTVYTVDNLGYGYLGINANLVKVGDDSGSDQSKDLRKGIATLLAVYRDTVIDSYYGDLANVIQYPISNTSWAAPKPADEGYSIAFSKDVDGKDLYTSDMTDEQKYDAALQASIGFFKAAGYTWDDAAKKFTAAPAGASMSYEVIIPADGSGDHPAYGILTNTKDALASIGITLEINDVSDGNILWDGLDAGTVEMWAAAWQATPDPDMYQIYYSKNIPENGGTNHYHIQDAQLDKLIVDARSSVDQSFRKATYKDCLNIILDWAVEIPNYQRQNATLVSTERVNTATMTPDITTFWGWMNDVQNLEMN